MGIAQPKSKLATKPSLLWQRLFGEARTRILVWYIFLMTVFLFLAFPLIRQRMFDKVDERVREDLREDIEQFRELVAGDLEERDIALREKFRREGRAMFTGTPKTQEELKTLVDVFLTRRIPEDDSFLIAFVGNKLYKASPAALPKPLRPDEELAQSWKQRKAASEGELATNKPKYGDILYFAEPVLREGEVLGVFVVAHLTAGERQEAVEALIVVIEVTAGLSTLAFFCAWLAAGRVLAPLRSLTATAHSISESDLTARIPVQGRGEIAEIAKTFNEMMDRLEAAFSLQRSFTNDASHELRTPITIIRGHLEVMGDDPAEQAETLDLVMDELDRMARLVEDLIMLAKSERPDFLQLETIDLDAFTRELLTKATALGDRDWRLDAVGTGKMVGDRQRLTEAVMNLAQNATQHTSTQNTIAIGSSLVRDTVRIWVRDTGEGIATSEQQRVFERFARAARTRRKSEGSGLGLSIVKAIVDAHSGMVALHSQLGKGSTFTLVLPVEAKPETAQEVVSHASNSNR
jgi:signal transduction histidine kinase